MWISGLVCRRLVSLSLAPEIPTHEKQNGEHKAPHFLHVEKIVCGHLSALCNCWVSCPGTVSLFAQGFQIALGRKSPTPPVWSQQRRGESQPSCTGYLWAWPRLRAFLLEHNDGTTCLPLASGLEWVPWPILFCSMTHLRAVASHPLGTLWEWLPFAS